MVDTILNKDNKKNMDIKDIIKHSTFLYSSYFYIGSILIRIFKFFLKEDPKLIVFSSFGGRKYDDSPRIIFERMLNDDRFNAFKIIWVFRQPDEFNLTRAKTIKIDTLKYYLTILQARVWITNTEMTRALNFSGKHTFSLNTWHGTPLKKIGKDVAKGEKVFVGKGEKGTDVFLAQGEYDRVIFSRAFNKSKEDVLLTGLPRNDELTPAISKTKYYIYRKKLGIAEEKKVILYAPTFRDYHVEKGSYVDILPIDLKKWEEFLGREYILLFRAHPAVVKTMDIRDNNFVRNVSNYPSLNDLMIASDILISDYSSIFFDYSIQGKPMISYCFDYSQYSKVRGMYMDIRTELPNAGNENQLLTFIKTMDWDVETKKAEDFRDKYVQKYGGAAERVLDLLAKKLEI